MVAAKVTVMPTTQPVWKILTNLGDRSPLDHGGYFIYEDTTGVYEPEAVLLEPLDDGKYIVYRFILERKKKVGPYLVPWEWDESWGKYSHGHHVARGVLDWTPGEIVEEPAKRYDEWFHDRLPEVARGIGMDVGELEEAFTSADPLVRANAYRDIGLYFGMDNLDSYPETYSKSEVKKRFRKELKR
jgi:hypothetical protein